MYFHHHWHTSNIITVESTHVVVHLRSVLIDKDHCPDGNVTLRYLQEVSLYHCINFCNRNISLHVVVETATISLSTSAVHVSRRTGNDSLSVYLWLNHCQEVLRAKFRESDNIQDDHANVRKPIFPHDTAAGIRLGDAQSEASYRH